MLKINMKELNQDVPSWFKIVCRIAGIYVLLFTVPNLFYYLQLVISQLNFLLSDLLLLPYTTTASAQRIDNLGHLFLLTFFSFSAIFIYIIAPIMPYWFFRYLFK